jgi:hypothetical protein
VLPECGVLAGCRGKIILTQFPEALAASQGDFISITCRSSMEVGTSMAWYHQKPQEVPRLLIFGASARAAGTPSRFRGSGSGIDFSLAIHGVEAEDIGTFYCQQHFSQPLTVTDPQIKTSFQGGGHLFCYRDTCFLQET